jgi:hypothetical protein
VFGTVIVEGGCGCGGCVKVSLFILDKNDNFASHVILLVKKKKNLPTLKIVTNFEKRTQSY